MKCISLFMFAPIPIRCFAFMPNRHPRSVAHSCLHFSIEHVFTEQFSEQVATEIEQNIEIPLVPSALIVYILAQVIEKIVSADISTESLEGIQEILEAEATPCVYDDVDAVTVDGLVNNLAVELNAVIDVPLLTEEVELDVLEKLLKVIFGFITSSQEDVKFMAAKQNIEISHDLLESEETRIKLAKHLNELVDIPLIGEAHEEAILVAAIDQAAKVIQDVLPVDVVKTLRGDSSEGIAKTKALVIDRINERVDLIGLSEEQEKVFLETLVDVLIDSYVGGTQVQFLFLDAEEQEELLLEMRSQATREDEFSRRRFEREQQSVQAELKDIDTKLEEIRRTKASQQ